MQMFSKRNNYASQEAEIITREEAPRGLREFIVQTLYALHCQPSTLRRIFCRVLRKAPDDSNWSEFPNIDSEVRLIIEECEWFKVYDLIEAIYEQIDRRQDFASEINDYFRETGIGWKLENGEIRFRGSEAFEVDLKKAEQIMAQNNLSTARNEISEAIRDLSRKPNPDITGAVQHSVASVECVAREITGATNLTLGELIKKHRAIVPPPLDKVVEQIWGYSSEQGRHLREGREPGFDEAELLVGLSASLGAYLAKKSKKLNATEVQPDLPDF
ncbi:MAG TPA: hypothetical protein VL442_23520 [Mucilaginibacter sp.]|jgi:hypothetical protein|nr:hypothetical protein [Mucilaginibacter sp.]